ncbi:unnamed protein product, partial [Symbiodinium sp. CCMP2456]
APGRLRVRCLGARDVHPFQVQIFGQGATYDPYAVLCIRRTVGDRYQKSRKRCTHSAGKTRHPCWREEFWFTLPTCPWEAEYVLEATIYGASQGRRHDEFLGYAELPLSTVQSEARLVEELPLGPPVGSAASAESEGSWFTSQYLGLFVMSLGTGESNGGNNGTHAAGPGGTQGEPRNADGGPPNDSKASQGYPSTDTPEKGEKECQILEVHVAHALTGASLGCYQVSPTDSVQDLKTQIAQRTNAERPWAADFKLLCQTDLLQEATLLKDAQLAEPIELQYLVSTNTQALERNDLVLIPEVIQKCLDPCTAKVYKPNVRWALKDFIFRASEAELLADWHREKQGDVSLHDLTDRTGPREPWLQLKEGHRGVRRDRHSVLSCEFRDGCLTFSYFAFKHSFQPPSMEEVAPRGWHAEGSPGDMAGRASAPFLSPRRHLHPGIYSPAATTRQLALPCAIAALRFEGLQVDEVLAADHLYGFGLGVEFDLLLAVRANAAAPASIVAVYFHVLQLPFDGKVHAFDQSFSDLILGRAVFEDFLNAAACESIAQVLVLWYADQARALRWYLSPVSSAFKDFRLRLAEEWLQPNGDERLCRFNELLRRDLAAQLPMEPILVDLPNNTCANALCRAGRQCMKHFHLFQVPYVEMCEPTCTRKGCPKHHCKGPVGPAPFCCVQLWQPRATSDPWMTPKGKKKLVNKKPKQQQAPDAVHTGLGAVGRVLESIKIAQTWRIRIELMWEAACSKQTDTFLRFVWRGMNTVMGLRFWSIAILAIAGLLLMVAQGSRWLCSGHTFADCHELEVPGARVAAVLGSMSAIASGITNFLGVAGFFGSSWREGAPMGLLDDVQSSYVDHQDDLAPSGWRQHSAPTLQLQVQQKHLFVWDVSVMAVDICPVKISLPSVRLLTWFGQGVALIMAQLTILLAWLEDAGPSRFLGEAVYLAFLAFVMLLTSAILSGREASVCLSSTHNISHSDAPACHHVRDARHVPTAPVLNPVPQLLQFLWLPHARST